MKIRAKIAAFGLALLSVIGMLSLAAPRAALASPTINTCDLSYKVNELRGWDTNGQYNILVWKDSAQGAIRLSGVALQDHHWAETCDGHGENGLPGCPGHLAL